MLATFYVGNPAWSITSEILEGVFGQFGTVLSARVETYPDIGRSRGYGLWRWMSTTRAAWQVRPTALELDGRSLLVTVQPV